MSGEIRYTETCGACGPAVTGMASCVNEFGEEWEYAGYGDCGMAPCSAFGTRAKCRHVRYSADKAACCLGTNTDPRRTCDPKYTIGTGGCDDVMAEYCAVGDRIMTDPKCINWANQRPAAARQLQTNYCLANMDKHVCRQWCKQRAAENDGICDTAFMAWCEVNSADPMCSCIKSPLSTKYGINPRCNDRACIDTGYIPVNMRNSACPNVVDCSVQATLINSGVQLTGLTVDQKCASAPSPTTDTARSGQLDEDMVWLLMLLLIVVVIVISVGLAVWVLSAGKNMVAHNI